MINVSILEFWKCHGPATYLYLSHLLVLSIRAPQGRRGERQIEGWRYLRYIHRSSTKPCYWNRQAGNSFVRGVRVHKISFFLCCIKHKSQIGKQEQPVWCQGARLPLFEFLIVCSLAMYPFSQSRSMLRNYGSTMCSLVEVNIC